MWRFAHHRHILFSLCLVDGYNDDVDLRKPAMARELQFFERVKQYLSNKEHYAEFLKCVTAADLCP